MENKRKDGKVPCMRCTEEQYKNDLKQPLLNMGFMEMDMQYSSEYTNIVTNWMNEFGYIGIAHYNCINTYNRFLIKPYNPELFLSEVRKCVYGEEENIDTKYPYWFINSKKDVKKSHARIIANDIVSKSNRNICFARLNDTLDFENILCVSNDLKFKNQGYFILKSEYGEDLPIDALVMCSHDGDRFSVRKYAGNGATFFKGDSSSDNKHSYNNWMYIIDINKFDLHNIEESLKHNIVK